MFALGSMASYTEFPRANFFMVSIYKMQSFINFHYAPQSIRLDFLLLITKNTTKHIDFM